MAMQMWHLWVVAAVILVIAELLVSGVVLLCFAVGLLAAAVASAAGATLAWQLGSFSAATLMFFVGVRPLTLRLLYGHARPTNIDALIGRRGRVSERIDLMADSGRVVVDGEDWRAVSVDDAAIEPGEFVTVLSVTGTRMVVVRIARETGG